MQAAGTPRGQASLCILGTICFRNTSPQCLSHTAPLARVFLLGDFMADHNRGNPLGERGKVAAASAALLCTLWQACRALQLCSAADSLPHRLSRSRQHRELGRRRWS